MPAGEDNHRHNKANIKSKANADSYKMAAGSNNYIPIKKTPNKGKPAEWKTTGALKVTFPGRTDMKEQATKMKYNKKKDDKNENDDNDEVDFNDDEEDKAKLTPITRIFKFENSKKDDTWKRVGRHLTKDNHNKHDDSRYSTNKDNNAEVNDDNNNDNVDDDDDDDNDDNDDDDDDNDGDDDNDDDDDDEDDDDDDEDSTKSNIFNTIRKMIFGRQDGVEEDEDDSILGRIKRMFTGNER